MGGAGGGGGDGRGSGLVGNSSTSTFLELPHRQSGLAWSLASQASLLATRTWRHRRTCSERRNRTE